MNSYLRLDECCQIELSSIDKKNKPNEKSVKLCNFTDVYYNWNIYSSMIDGFMEATASDKNISSFLLKKGDVVVTKDSETRDDIGMAALVYEDLPNTVLGYHCALIRPKKNIDGAYLNAYLNSYLGRKHFRNQASGSGQRYTLTKESLGSIKIPVIPMTEQKKIGAFFSDIDKKIQNNIQTTTNLESLAKTIYDYWFLQFEFPNEDGKPYKSSGGKMVWNDELKREIPEGWKVEPLFQCMDVTYGYPLSTNFFNQEEGTPVIRIRDILDNSTSAYTTEKIPDKYISESKDLLVGMDGNFHMNYCCEDGQYINQRIVRIREKDNISTMQVCFEIAPYIKKKEQNVARSTVGHLSDKDLKSIYILNSNNIHIYKVFNGFLEKICTARKENKKLTALRDFLLPMLMNGQVTFKEDE